ncbi:MAG: DUF2064 domain-containing protein [Maribacter sp.]|nr:DUF2064 domain-containing protein [Maribacter sp.]
MQGTNKHNLAILIFALTAQEELKRKKINSGGDLFNALSEHSLKIVAKSGLPYFHYTEKEQEGDTFGERFTNAIQSVFNRGYKQIITIGNDSPQLKASHIRKAAKLLANDKSVLGPSADGGFYLMGMHRENFNANRFKDLPWQTSSLRRQLKKEFSTAQIDIVQLDRLFDIDNSQDLYSLAKFASQLSYHISRIIRFLIATTPTFFKIGFLLKVQFQSKSHHNRGSPLLHLE